MEYNLGKGKKQSRRGRRRTLVDVEEKDVDIVAQKYLLMLVHALTLFEADEIIASMSLGFDEFEQEFEVVCALAFSPPSQLPNRGGEEFSYLNNLAKVNLTLILKYRELLKLDRLLMNLKE